MTTADSTRPRQATATRLTLFGYCLEDEAALLARFHDQGPASLVALPGEYVIAVQAGSDQWLASSAHGFHEYFYAIHNGALLHADAVSGVLPQGPLPWRWNYRALANLFHLEHGLGDETLHPDVRRVPPASLVAFVQGRVTVTRRSFDEVHPPPTGVTTSAEVRQALQTDVARWLRPDSIVTMSAGFDSRVLLACLLHAGHRPELVTTGFADSTDVLVSRAIARAFDLPIRVIPCDPDEYLADGATIAARTSGTKTAWHWHSYLFPKHAGYPRERTVFVGSNGEFARSDFFNLGHLARLADRLPPALMHRIFWPFRIHSALTPPEHKLVHQDLAVELENWSPARLVACSPGSFVAGLDRFFLEERVRHFHADGLRLYGESLSPRLPFLDREWVTRVRGLPRAEKLGSKWHRDTIAALCPRLLAFPEGARAPRVSRSVPPFYWVPRPWGNAVPYARYGEWFRQGPLDSFLYHHADELAPLFSPHLLRKIVEEHRRQGQRGRALALFLSLLFWQRVVM